MKIKKILAGLLASAFALSATVLSASAAEKELTAYAIFGMGEGWESQYWGPGNEDNTFEDTEVKTTKIKEDGMHDVVLDLKLESFNEADFDKVWVIKAAFEGLKEGDNVTVALKKVMLDDKELNITIPSDFGDTGKAELTYETLEENKEYNVYNEWAAKLIELPSGDEWRNASKLTMTFEVKGLSDTDNNGGAATTDDETTNPTTGIPASSAGMVTLIAATLAAGTLFKKK